MMEAYKEALKAYKKNEIPIGAVVVVNNEIVARGYNLRDSSNIVTKHAEIIAIEKANKALDNWRLVDATLYTTLKPCKMCQQVINEAKVIKVIYGADNDKNSLDNINLNQIKSTEIIKKCEDLIKEKFKEIRTGNVSRETLED